MPIKHTKNKRLYNIWVNMRQRCKNDGKPGHDYWGNRGIRVCEEWHKFEAFSEWAYSNGYSDDLTIDRIDNNKGYSPGNCRWATYKEQALNTRKNRFVELFGESKTVTQWCQELNIVTPCTVYRRVRNYGWTYEKALTTPPQKWKMPSREPGEYGAGVRRTNGNRFSAYIHRHRKQIYLGTFDTAEDARNARLEAEK